MILNVAGLVLTRQEVWPQELSHNGGSLQDAPALRSPGVNPLVRQFYWHTGTSVENNM